MVDPIQQGEKERGEKEKRLSHKSQKCLGSKIGEASALAWGDIA